ncbi:MAG: glycosyl hydrolase [Ferruginibacter sp.]|nr:glycosyl hydrolase [Ferruginibacter sp.]
MKNKLLLVFSMGALVSCNNGDKTTTTDTSNADSTMSKKDSTKDGWTTLFDGTTTAGWHSYGKDKAGDRWKIADGALYVDTSKIGGKPIPGGDLVTDAEYGNFDLKLEWKIAPKGNSGIIIYTHEDTTKYKTTYNTGPEMQVLDNDGHPDGKIKKHRAGDLYDLISSSKETVKPVGEWNEVEITSKDGKLDFFLNGTNVVSTTMWDDNWKKLIAGSKFKNMPDFGTFKRGKIVLQDHGDMVSYRNIKIKEL